MARGAAEDLIQVIMIIVGEGKKKGIRKIAGGKVSTLDKSTRTEERNHLSRFGLN